MGTQLLLSIGTQWDSWPGCTTSPRSRTRLWSTIDGERELLVTTEDSSTVLIGVTNLNHIHAQFQITRHQLFIAMLHVITTKAGA